MTNTKIRKLTPFTVELQEQFCEHIERGITHRDASTLVGINERTCRRWRAMGRKAPDSKYGAFCRAVDAAEERARAALERMMVSAENAKWWLKRRFPDEFKRRFPDG